MSNILLSKIDLIKMVRIADRACGLKEAKDAVEAAMGVVKPAPFGSTMALDSSIFGIAIAIVRGQGVTDALRLYGDMDLLPLDVRVAVENAPQCECGLRLVPVISYQWGVGWTVRFKRCDGDEHRIPF